METSSYLKKAILCTILCVFVSSATVFAQPTPNGDEPAPANTGTEFAQKYAWRIKQTQLNGRYIPYDLFDAFKEMAKLTDTTQRAKFKALSEYDAEHRTFFGLGRWIQSEWSLYEGSRFSHYLKEAGLSHPEDMSVAFLICWHRYLNGKDINFKEVRERLVAKRVKEREERLKRGTVIEQKTLPPPAKKN